MVHVNIGTSSKKRYRYFVPNANPGTLEVAPKDRNVYTQVCLSGTSVMEGEVARVKLVLSPPVIHY